MQLAAVIKNHNLYWFKTSWSADTDIIFMKGIIIWSLLIEKWIAEESKSDRRITWGSRLLSLDLRVLAAWQNQFDQQFFHSSMVWPIHMFVKKLVWSRYDTWASFSGLVQPEQKKSEDRDWHVLVLKGSITCSPTKSGLRIRRALGYSIMMKHL